MEEGYEGIAIFENVSYFQGHQLTTQMLQETGVSFGKGLLQLDLGSPDNSDFIDSSECKMSVEKDQSMRITK